jgi:hypothetical protein
LVGGNSALGLLALPELFGQEYFSIIEQNGMSGLTNVYPLEICWLGHVHFIPLLSVGQE